MKFKCWMNEDERVISKSKWHKWFAWYPIVIGKDCYWLEFVERKNCYKFHYYTGWVYIKAHFRRINGRL